MKTEREIRELIEALRPVYEKDGRPMPERAACGMVMDALAWVLDDPTVAACEKGRALLNQICFVHSIGIGEEMI